MVRDQLEEGVPSNRVVLEASVPSIADGGDDAQVGASLQVAAQWVMDPKTSQTVPVSYTHLDVYKRQGVDHALKLLQITNNFSYTRDDETNTIHIKITKI